MLEIMGLEMGPIDKKKYLLGSNQITMLNKVPIRKMACSSSVNISLSGSPNKLPTLKIHKQKSSNAPA